MWELLPFHPLHTVNSARYMLKKDSLCLLRRAAPPNSENEHAVCSPDMSLQAPPATPHLLDWLFTMFAVLLNPQISGKMISKGVVFHWRGGYH